MNNKKSMIKLFLILLFMITGIYLCMFGINEEKEVSVKDIKLGLDLAGGVSITYQVVGEEEPSPEDMADTIYKLQKRVTSYSTESLVYQEGADRINIEIPGVSDANAILEELGKPGSLEFIDVNGNVVLNGTDIKNAQPMVGKDSMGNSQYVVELVMTEEGTKKFAEATQAAVANHDIIYIVYDEEIVSAPSVQAAITDGYAIVEGMASYDEAELLAEQQAENEPAEDDTDTEQE